MALQRRVLGRAGTPRGSPRSGPAPPLPAAPSVCEQGNCKGKNPRGCGELKSCQRVWVRLNILGVLPVPFWVPLHVERHLLPQPRTRTGFAWELGNHAGRSVVGAGGALGLLTRNGNKVLFLPK